MREEKRGTNYSGFFSLDITPQERVLPYPFNHNTPFAKRNVIARLRTWYESIRIISREKRDSITIQLSQLNSARGLLASDIPLVVITHNDITLIPTLLTHYRKLGVTRFICVDDISSDGTREYLLGQPDTDVWVSPIRFADARRGRRWREQLFKYYGYNRWYLNIDSDEFLLYDNCQNIQLQELISALEKSGEKRLAAPMLDMYASNTATEMKPTSDMPWHFAKYFDRSGYQMSLEKRGISITGGPRGRKFDESNQLIKFPLIYWDEQCFFGSSLHRPTPYERNFTTIWGALLHFKFYVNYREKIAEATVEQQHYGGSVHYKKMMNEIDEKGEIELHDEVSIEFTGPDQLVDLGFMSKIEWDTLKR